LTTSLLLLQRAYFSAMAYAIYIYLLLFMSLNFEMPNQKNKTQKRKLNGK